jgi:hypothetical protein
MPDADSSFFTRRAATRYILPHEPLGERWLLVVHAALTAAFVIIRECGFDLRNAQENAITNKLEDVLRNDLLIRGTVDGFDKQFFGPVTRGSEVENYSGKKISKKTDLVFHLRRENVLWDQRQDALFAECKPVDKKHPLNANYCAVGTDRTGIERFVIGDYAWAMEEALMVGYVQDGLAVHPHLSMALKDEVRRSKLGTPSPPVSVEPPTDVRVSTVLYQTTHQRAFVWSNGLPATPIALFHSWHDCQ